MNSYKISNNKHIPQILFLFRTLIANVPGNTICEIPKYRCLFICGKFVYFGISNIF